MATYELTSFTNEGRRRSNFRPVYYFTVVLYIISLDNVSMISLLDMTILRHIMRKNQPTKLVLIIQGLKWVQQVAWLIYAFRLRFPIARLPVVTATASQTLLLPDRMALTASTGPKLHHLHTISSHPPVIIIATMEDTKLAVLIGAAILLFYLIITKRDPARASSHTALPKAIIIENIFGVAWRAKLAYNTNHLALYHQRHGKTFRLEPLFGTRQIISADPDNIYEILNGKDWGVGRRRDSMKDLVGQGMLVLEGDEWAKARRMYKPAFARKNLDDFGFLGALIDMVLEKIPGGGETVDLAPLLGDAVSHEEVAHGDFY